MNKPLLIVVVFLFIYACKSDSINPILDLSGEWNLLHGGLGEIEFRIEDGSSAQITFGNNNYTMQYFLPVIDNGISIDTLSRDENGQYIIYNTSYVDGQINGTTKGWGGQIDLIPNSGTKWSIYFRTIEDENRMSVDIMINQNQLLVLELQK